VLLVVFVILDVLLGYLNGSFLLSLTFLEMSDVLAKHGMVFVSDGSLPFEKGIAAGVPSHSVKGTLEEAPGEVDLLEVVNPASPAVLLCDFSASKDHLYAPILNELLTLVGFSLISEFEKGHTLASTSLNFLKFHESSIHVANLNSSFDPFIETTLHVVSAQHVGDVVQLGHSVSLDSSLLPCLNLLSSELLIGEILVFVKVIPCDLQEFSVNFLVGGLFPGHEAILKSDVMPVSQLHFKAVHSVSVVNAVFFPDLEGAVLQVTVT